jgi:hypothetical protein
MRNVLLAIDPGKWKAGAALFSDEGTLLSAKLLSSRSKNPAQAAKEIGDEAAWFCMGQVDTVCCEMPNIRKRSRQKGDPNDLLYLTLINGAVFTAVEAESRDLVPVNDWKGSIDKEVMAGRITGRWPEGFEPLVAMPAKLSVTELRLLGDEPNHNVLDAVGIGLWKLKRL